METSIAVVLWPKVTKSRIELNLIRKCVKEKVALNEVTKITRNLAKQIKTIWGKRRVGKMSDAMMLEKVKVAEKALREVEAEQQKMKTEIENNYDKNSRKSKNIFRRARF